MPDDREIYKSLFNELCGCNAQAISSRLSATEFSDISRNELLVLAALSLSRQAETDLRRELEFSSGAVDELTDKLVLRGYLENSGNPDDRDRTMIKLTDRARQALVVAVQGVQADRWASFPLRPGDIVISTPPRSGTTWMQMICALLIFQTPDLPASIKDLSPWIDQHRIIRDEVFERLFAQEHRRFIKTHSPMVEINVVPQVTYIVVGRNPLDAAISLYHQLNNNRVQDDAPREWLLKWIASELLSSPPPPTSLLGVLRHISDAWARRDAPNIVLMHYEDLSADLESEMRFLATRLGITVPRKLWPGLVKAATFDHMRAVADRIQPYVDLGKDNAAFFRAGRSGSGTELLTVAELADYHARVAKALPPDLMAWLHRPELV
jgi:aryl sulfotransferase